MVNPDHTFHIVDYVIFSVTIIVSLGIGIYAALSGGKQRTTSEYLLGNRKMAVLPVAISLMVSFESSIMMLGTPAEVYVFGLQLLISQFGWLTANLLATKLVVPLLHPLKLTSTYEYLEMRFQSRAVRLLGTVLGILVYAAYMGIVLFGPAIALEAVTGFPIWGSILSVAAASVIYTSIGGLKAVIWTDVFQCAVMYSGFVGILIKGTVDIGGVAKTWEVAAAKGRVNVFNFDTDPRERHTFWNLYVGTIIRGFGLIFNQSSVQRIGATPTVWDGIKVFLFTAPAFLITGSMAMAEGIIAYSYYDTRGCDPLASGQIKNPNQIIPYMVMDMFKGLYGLPGLFLAALFSASLSTLSSGLSSLSAIFLEDVVKSHAKPMSELKATIIAKLSVLMFGVLAVLISLLIAQIGGTLVQITGSVLAAFGAPLTALFMLGCFFPCANSKGALVGGITSCLFVFWLSMGQMLTKGTVKVTPLPAGPVTSCSADNSKFSISYNASLVSETTVGYALYTTDGVTATEPTEPILSGIQYMYTVSYQWFGAIGILWTLVVGVIVSFLTGPNKPGDVDSRLLIPFYDRLFCCLPECIRKPLRCGIDYNKGMDEKVTEYIATKTNIHLVEIEVEKESLNTEDKHLEVNDGGSVLGVPVYEKGMTDASQRTNGYAEMSTNLTEQNNSKLLGDATIHKAE